MPSPTTCISISSASVPPDANPEFIPPQYVMFDVDPKEYATDVDGDIIVTKTTPRE